MDPTHLTIGPELPWAHPVLFPLSFSTWYENVLGRIITVVLGVSSSGIVVIEAKLKI